jgi:hypothetical protein
MANKSTSFTPCYKRSTTTKARPGAGDPREAAVVPVRRWGERAAAREVGRGASWRRALCEKRFVLTS